jgi:hypothetical protein
MIPRIARASEIGQPDVVTRPPKRESHGIILLRHPDPRRLGHSMLEDDHTFGIVLWYAEHSQNVAVFGLDSVGLARADVSLHDFLLQEDLYLGSF